MTPYYEDDAVTIYHGDCREVDAWDVAGGVMVTDPPLSTANGRSSTAEADCTACDWSGAVVVMLERKARRRAA